MFLAIFNDRTAMTLKPRWDRKELEAAYFSPELKQALALSPPNGPGGSWGPKTAKHFRERDVVLKLKFDGGSHFYPWELNHGEPWGKILPITYWKQTRGRWATEVERNEDLEKKVRTAIRNRSMAPQPWVVQPEGTAPAATAPTAATAPITAVAATAPTTTAAARAPTTAAAATAPTTAAAATERVIIADHVSAHRSDPEPDLLRQRGEILMHCGGGCTGTQQSDTALHLRFLEGNAAAAKAPNTATPYRTSGATPCRGSPPPATPVPLFKAPPPIGACDAFRVRAYDASFAVL